MTEPNRPETQYTVMRAWWALYIHLAAWGLPEYVDLDAEDRALVTEVVNRGKSVLEDMIENAKLIALAFGLGNRIKDHWLEIIGFDNFDVVEGFDEETRGRLRRHASEMYPLLVRLSPLPHYLAERFPEITSPYCQSNEQTHNGRALSLLALPGPLPETMSATKLAEQLRQPVPRVESFLRRYREHHWGCFQEMKDARKNEPRILYRTAEVLPALEKELPNWQRFDMEK